MSTALPAAAPPRTVTLAEWDTDYARREEMYELVDGIPIMSPTEILANNNAIAALIELLRPVLRDQWYVVPHQAVVVTKATDFPTVRIPDVAVISRSGTPRDHRFDATEVAMVAEIVSDSSVETDWIHKRADYAAAGIPTYLIVDVRPDRDGAPAQPRVYAFTDAAPDETGALHYAVPDADGTATTITVGETTLTIRAADLAP